MRPRVIVQIRPSKSSINLLNFEIKNVGNTPALDISCHFDPDIRYQKTDLQLSQLPIFSNLNVLAPKEEIVFLFASAIEYFNDPSKPPMETKATVSYRSDTNEKYEEKITIKINQLEKVYFAEEKGLNSVAEELRRMERILERLDFTLRQRGT
jgi:hypothetical protein